MCFTLLLLHCLSFFFFYLFLYCKIICIIIKSSLDEFSYFFRKPVFHYFRIYFSLHFRKKCHLFVFSLWILCIYFPFLIISSLFFLHIYFNYSYLFHYDSYVWLSSILNDLYVFDFNLYSCLLSFSYLYIFNHNLYVYSWLCSSIYISIIALSPQLPKIIIYTYSCLLSFSSYLYAFNHNLYIYSWFCLSSHSYCCLRFLKPLHQGPLFSPRSDPIDNWQHPVRLMPWPRVIFTAIASLSL